MPRAFLWLSTSAMPPRHAFAALSPAERQASLRTADTWPVLSVSEDAASARVYAAARHYDSNVNLNNAPLTPHSSVLASLALYWAVVTGKPKDLDVNIAGRLNTLSSSSSTAPYTSAAMDTKVCRPRGGSKPGCRGSYRPRTPSGVATQYAGTWADACTCRRKQS